MKHLKRFEAMSVDSSGRLRDESSKILYPYEKISKFVEWFRDEWGDYVRKQGWDIFLSDSSEPTEKYKLDSNVSGFFRVERIDDPTEGEGLFGRLKSDIHAEELAKKLGLVLDEYGVVIGWQDDIFI
jgi:hypothetical protein